MIQSHNIPSDIKWRYNHCITIVVFVICRHQTHSHSFYFPFFLQYPPWHPHLPFSSFSFSSSQLLHLPSSTSLPLARPWPQCNLSVSSQPRSYRQGLVKYNFWCLSNWEQKIIPVIMRCTRRQWSSPAISYFSGWNGCNDQRIWTWSQRSPWVLSKKFKDAFFVLYPLHTHHPHHHHHLVTMQLGNCFECAVKDSGARQCQGFYREIWNS